MDKKTRDQATDRVREFYDGPADTVYKTTWGENLHLGKPKQAGESQEQAMENRLRGRRGQKLTRRDRIQTDALRVERSDFGG